MKTNKMKNNSRISPYSTNDPELFPESFLENLKRSLDEKSKNDHDEEFESMTKSFIDNQTRKRRFRNEYVPIIESLEESFESSLLVEYLTPRYKSMIVEVIQKLINFLDETQSDIIYFHKSQST